jgi:hypothetical protein
MKTLLAVTVAASLPLLAACGGGGDTTADDPQTTPSSTAGSPSGTPTGFEPTSYSYRLQAICYCPLTSPVDVTVEDDEVVSAVYAKGGNGLTKGDDAPKSLWLTIDDILARAADPKVDHADVDWPDGADYPSKVALDPIENAMDDEITYVIKDVSVSGG